MAQQAQETFVAEMADGSSVRVAKGEVFPDSHELVKRDQSGSGSLFKKLDLGEDEKPPAKSGPATAPVKSGGKA
jgi:hypothetical protein